jgi:uncharacterized phage-associated protein
MTWSAKGVANLFLDLADESERTIDPLTMQKLVYFGEGWHLALLDSSLVVEQFEAWKRGPVVPTLYHALKGYGASPIRDRLVTIEVDIPRQSIRTVEAQRPTEGGSCDLVKEVWRVYQRYSGGQLVAFTHQRGSPWEVTWREANGAPDARIPKERIRDWFRAESDKSQGRNLL